jgi:hypothetical protein
MLYPAIRPKSYELRIDPRKILDALARADERIGDFVMKMALVVPQASAVTQLKHIFNNLAPTDPILNLYVNNVTPGSSDVASTYTAMTTQGYTAKTLAGGSWSFTAGSPSHADFALQTWTFDGTGGSTSVYGYYITKTTSGLLLLSERFTDGPYVVVNNGDQIKITPIETLTS